MALRVVLEVKPKRAVVNVVVDGPTVVVVACDIANVTKSNVTNVSKAKLFKTTNRCIGLTIFIVFYSILSD